MNAAIKINCTGVSVESVFSDGEWERRLNSWVCHTFRRSHECQTVTEYPLYTFTSKFQTVLIRSGDSEFRWNSDAQTSSSLLLWLFLFFLFPEVPIEFSRSNVISNNVMGTSEAMLVHSKTKQNKTKIKEKNKGKRKEKTTNKNPLLLQKLSFHTKHLLRTDNHHASYI